MADVTVTPTVTLNSGSIDVTVYEDLDGDGQVENSETVTGVTSGSTYTLTTLDGGSGNNYHVGADLNSTDATDAPTVHSIDVTVPVAGSKLESTSTGALEMDSTGYILTV